MKRIILFAALSLTSFANPAAGSVSRAAAAAVQALPPGAPFRDEILRFAQQDRESPPPHCALLFVGSSSIRLWSSLAEDMAPLPVINRGFGGSTISQSNLYFDRIVAPYHPRAIVFYAGENDLDAGESPRAVAADFRQFMAKKRATLGSTPVFYISAKPSKLRFSQFGRQTKLNQAIRTQAAKSSDLTFVDVVPPMMGGGQPRDLYVKDRLHMSSEGYAIWRRLVRQALAKRKVDQRRCG
jgi:lysophospholipase L1-like esterase